MKNGLRSIVSKTLILAILMMPSLASGAPFLTCDEPPEKEQVTHYTVNGSRVDSMTIGKSLWYDLAAIPDGDFSLQVQACNVWGCSDPAPFVSRRVVPGTPAGNRIVTGE